MTTTDSPGPINTSSVESKALTFDSAADWQIETEKMIADISLDSKRKLEAEINPSARASGQRTPYTELPIITLDSPPEHILSPKLLTMPFGDVLNEYSKFDSVDQAKVKFVFRQKLGILEEHSIRSSKASERSEKETNKAVPNVSKNISTPHKKPRVSFITSILHRLRGKQ
ncbi:hypothetical protein F5Y11DRAFT_367013 [Daldinia sp. FL1419]|nr:hypothetical protein F5Y11DRAFT_367013 [Daldinia sp. FL1419]